MLNAARAKALWGAASFGAVETAPYKAFDPEKTLDGKQEAHRTQGVIVNDSM
jgi:hypothetical protein